MQYFVHPQNGDFKTPEDAVKNAEEGSLIIISEGTYILKEPLKLKPKMKLKGDAGQKVILKSENDAVIECENADKVELQNLTIVGGSPSKNKAAVVMKSSLFVKIKSCNIENSRVAGIHIEESAVTVANCKILQVQGYGIFVTQGSDVEVTGCVLKNEAKPALWFEEHSTGKITNNEISQNFGNGITIAESSDIIIEKNKIKENHYSGCLIIDSKKVTLVKNHIAYNRANGIVIKDSKDINVHENRIWGHQNPAVWIKKANVSLKNNEIYEIRDNAVVVEDNGSLDMAKNLFVRCGTPSAPVVWISKGCKINENAENVNEFIEVGGFQIYYEE